MYHVKEVTLHYAIIKIYFSLMKPMLMTVLTTDTHVSGLLTGNRVAYADTSQGPHTFAVVARDGDGLGERSEVHFEGEPIRTCPVVYIPRMGMFIAEYRRFDLEGYVHALAPDVSL